MKRLIKIKTPSGNFSETLSFEAQAVMIQNPTSKTIAIRTGGLDVPNELEDADFYVPPGGVLVMPVISNSFAGGFVEPSFSFIPSGMPTTATILFLANETIPQFGAMSTVDTNVNNAINATITNATIEVTQAATWDTNITNATLAVEQSGTWNIAATIANASIAVTQSGTWNVSAIIANAAIAVTQSGTWNLNATISNASIAVTQSGTWNLNASITNASLNMAITGSTINLPIQNATGDILDAYANAPIDTSLFVAAGVGTSGTHTNVFTLPSNIRSITLTKIHINVSKIVIAGGNSGITYIDVENPQAYAFQDKFSALVYPSLDSSLSVTFITTGATTTPSYRLVGHTHEVHRTETYEGATFVKGVAPILSNKTGINYDLVVAAGTVLATVSSYIPGLAEVTYVRGVYVYCDPTNSANQVRVIVEITNTAGTVIYFRFCDVRSQAGVLTDLYVPIDGIRITQNMMIRVQRQNTDTLNRRVTAFVWVEGEQI